jgi:hypothetical protein
MPNTDLFLSLAEIAGVFVGFGALIAVRSGGAQGMLEVAYMRSVVSMGALTVVASLAPVTLGEIGLSAHQIWATSSILVLVGWFTLLVAAVRTREYRASMAASLEADRTTRSRWVVVPEGVAYVLFVAASLLLPVVIVLHLAPELEAALYLIVVELVLLAAGWALLSLVFAGRDAPLS